MIGGKNFSAFAFSHNAFSFPKKTVVLNRKRTEIKCPIWFKYNCISITRFGSELQSYKCRSFTEEHKCFVRKRFSFANEHKVYMGNKKTVLWANKVSQRTEYFWSISTGSWANITVNQGSQKLYEWTKVSQRTAKVLRLNAKELKYNFPSIFLFYHHVPLMNEILL